MEPLPAPPGSVRGARRILVVVAVIHLFFVVCESRGQLRGLFAGSAVAAGPLVRGYDGHGYYAWLRSLLIDGDWQFGNDFDTFRATQPAPDAELSRTPTGRVMNQWSVGPAILWALTVVPVYAVVGGDGYSPPYQLAIAAATFVAAMLTLVLFYLIARRFASPVPAACAAAVMTLGTSVVGYGSVEVAMAHGPATTALAGFVYLWLRTFGGLGVRRWFALGFVLGVAALFRWQLVTFAVLPALEALWLCRGRAVACLLAFGGGAVVGFLPQMIAWQVVYGQPLVQPHGPAKNWLNPALAEVLFSADRGFFYWTPLALVAFAGLISLRAPLRVAATQLLSAMLGFAALVQIYAMAAVFAPPVSLGGSFGFRFLTETCVVLVPGVAILLARFPRVGLSIAGVFVGWNLLLLGVHRYAIDGFHAGGPAAMFHAVSRYVVLRPIDAGVVIGCVLWLTATMATAFGRSRHFNHRVTEDTERRQRPIRE